MQIKKTSGITLIEIIIVLIIIGVLALFALPNIPEMRKKTEAKSCIGNLWIIKMAKDQWALDENRITGASVTWNDIVSDYIDRRPVCPTTKTSDSYDLKKVGKNPTCDQEGEFGHKIE